MNTTVGSRLANIMFACLAIIVGAWFSFYNNFFNWDLVAYVGVVLGYDGLSITEVHRVAFETIQQQLPNDVVQALLHEAPYREQCFTDARFYEAQLGFYRVKPLFTGIIYLFYKSGLPLWTAMRMPGMLGFASMAIVLMIWLNKLLKPGWSHLVAVLLLAGYATQLARLVTPDALCAFFTLSLFYNLYYYPARKMASWCWLVLLVLCRIDNLVLALPLAVWHMAGDNLLKLPRRQYIKVALGAFGIVLLALLIPLLFGNKLTWYFDYSITNSYIEYVKSAGRSIRQLSGTWLPILAALLVVGWPREHKAWQWILGSILFAIAIRWVLFPTFQERFFVGYELVMCCYFIQRISQTISQPSIFTKPLV
jgi:hypothetical protein